MLIEEWVCRTTVMHDSTRQTTKIVGHAAQQQQQWNEHTGIFAAIPSVCKC
jgi:hypothetical protein